MSFSTLLHPDGSLYVWGFNGCGQLGLGDKNYRIVPTKLEGYQFKSISSGKSHNVAIDLEGNTWVWGDNLSGELGLGDTIDRTVPTKLEGFQFKSISSGDSYSIAIDLDANVWGKGI